MGGTHVSSRGYKGATALLRVQAEASPRTRCLGRVQGLCECDGPVPAERRRDRVR